MTDAPSPAQQLIGDFSPKMVSLTEQLPGHLKRARANGGTETELVEVITHLALYSGWPRAMSAITVAKSVFAEGTSS